jgi:hypothetical protein
MTSSSPIRPFSSSLLRIPPSPAPAAVPLYYVPTLRRIGAAVHIVFPLESTLPLIALLRAFNK